MKLLLIFILCAAMSPVALSQTKPVVRLQAQLDFGEQEPDEIVAHELLDDGNTLLLVGRKAIRRLDMSSGTLSKAIYIDNPNSVEDSARVFSPDGTRMLVFGNYHSKAKTDKVKHPPSIWDLQTGKQLAVLDKTSRPIRSASWTPNGKILVTSSDRFAPQAFDSNAVEVSFWDGQTFRFQSRLPSDKVAWFYLAGDGTRCFYSVGKGKNVLLIIKYIADAGGPINVWAPIEGKLVKTIPVDNAYGANKVHYDNISQNEQFFLFESKESKSEKLGPTLMVWENDKSSNQTIQVKPKFELKFPYKFHLSGAAFSPDGKYLSVKGKQNLGVYETSTGEEKFEVEDALSTPQFWLDNDNILLFAEESKMEAFEVSTGRKLYQLPIYYSESQYSDGDSTYTVVEDSTKVLVNPQRNLLLTFSKQLIDIIDSRTGTHLQNLVTPPMDYTKKKPRVSSIPLVSEADWSSDGKRIFAISADRKSVSLWSL